MKIAWRNTAKYAFVILILNGIFIVGDSIKRRNYNGKKTMAQSAADPDRCKKTLPGID